MPRYEAMCKSGYSLVDRALHRLALGWTEVAEASFNADRLFAKADGAPVAGRKHVFVTGLARAGTTITMRRLFATGSFRSLTYRDMPFVLAPNLWKRIRGGQGRGGSAAERAHGDGIKVDPDSPESLDEVFWRVFCGSDYIRANSLDSHHPNAEMQRRFREYIARVLASDDLGRQRYLSKNNNNILRLRGISEALPKAIILVPFREPFSHATSLKLQHERFCHLQAGDRFIRSYMGWLGHHEFGLDHRPFRFKGTAASMSAVPSDLVYWLDRWYEAHAWLLSHDLPNLYFVSYAHMCAQPQYWKRIAELCNVAGHTRDEERLEVRPAAEAGTVDPMIAERCLNLLHRLNERSIAL